MCPLVWLLNRQPVTGTDLKEGDTVDVYVSIGSGIEATSLPYDTYTALYIPVPPKK